MHAPPVHHTLRLLCTYWGAMEAPLRIAGGWAFRISSRWAQRKGCCSSVDMHQVERQGPEEDVAYSWTARRAARSYPSSTERQQQHTATSERDTERIWEGRGGPKPTLACTQGCSRLDHSSSPYHDCHVRERRHHKVSKETGKARAARDPGHHAGHHTGTGTAEGERAHIALEVLGLDQGSIVRAIRVLPRDHCKPTHKHVREKP
eukprot:scaffold5581_cov229-Prasinococcus_capsulatus_cf.AAC.10